MSESETSETCAGSPLFKPEMHSWIWVNDSDSFRKESAQTTNDADASAATASEEATDTSCVTAESIILGRAVDSITASSSSVTSPADPPLCDPPKLSSSKQLTMTDGTTSGSMALPRPWMSPVDGAGVDNTTDDSAQESACFEQQLTRWRRPLAICAALLASHFGVLMLGIYIGRQQGPELTCLARRFSSGPTGWHSRLCAA